MPSTTERAAPFRALCAELGVDPALLAHRYALDMEGVDTVVLGVKNRAELAQCLEAEALGRLPAELREDRRIGAGSPAFELAEPQVVDQGHQLVDRCVGHGKLRLARVSAGQPQRFNTAFVARIRPRPYSAIDRRASRPNAGEQLVAGPLARTRRSPSCTAGREVRLRAQEPVRRRARARSTPATDRRRAPRPVADRVDDLGEVPEVAVAAVHADDVVEAVDDLHDRTRPRRGSRPIDGSTTPPAAWWSRARRPSTPRPRPAGEMAVAEIE